MSKLWDLGGQTKRKKKIIIYEGNTLKILDHDTTMDLDVSNIDKTILLYVGPSTRQFINVTSYKLKYLSHHLSIF